jgi:hypothetical protein
MSEPLRCSICDLRLDAIPQDAVAIGRRHAGYQMYRFQDGSVHDLGFRKHTPRAVKEKSDGSDG